LWNLSIQHMKFPAMPADYQLESIILPKGNGNNFIVAGNEESSQTLISGLSRINFLVGSNNSGKSRILRNLLTSKNLLFRPKKFCGKLQECSQFIKREIEKLIPPNTQVGPFQHLAEQLPDYDSIMESTDYLKPLQDFINRAMRAQSSDLIIEVSGLSRFPDTENLASKIRSTGEAAKALLDEAGTIEPDKFDFKRIYLPALRGLRSLGTGPNDVYYVSTIADYFENISPPDIFTGLSFYQELQDLLLGDRSQRESVREFENYLSAEIFDGQRVSLIPRKGSNSIWVRIGREPERQIHLLGDGVQQLIILTFPLFRNLNAPSHVMIEEPELYLHPGMQRSLIKAFIKFDNYQYFIATHSNHLLDLTIEYDDISIYMLKKQNSGQGEEEHQPMCEIIPASTHDLRLLEELGTRTSSVFLSNCTVWVEGITDRRYLTHFLELYSKHLKKEAIDKEPPFIPRQDFHFSFVEYSGGNITHWSFLERTCDPIEVKRLCGRLMLVVDKDGADWKTKRHEELEKALGTNLLLLECREIENLLDADVIKQVLVDYGEDPNLVNPLEFKDYSAVSMGNFIMEKLSHNKRIGGYAEASGTLKNKVDFCTKSIMFMDDFDKLTRSAQETTIRIYNFIKENNI
jgi:hypothetical protein